MLQRRGNVQDQQQDQEPGCGLVNIPGKLSQLLGNAGYLWNLDAAGKRDGLALRET